MLAASGTAAGAVVDRWGSHPLLDACYGSAAVDFRHEGICYSRVDKLHVLAQWPVALDNLRVCTKNFMPGDELGYADLPLGEYNCGRCEKCIRTMLDLLLIGKLAASDAFPYDDLTPDALEPLRVRQAWLADKYEQTMIPPLRSMGRDDIADALQRKIVNSVSSRMNTPPVHLNNMLARRPVVGSTASCGVDAGNPVPMGGRAVHARECPMRY